MALTKIAIFAVVCVAAAVQARPDFTQSEEDFENQFHVLVDNKHKAAAEKTLKEAEAQINEENEKEANGEATFKEEVNELSIMPLAEFKKEKEGYIAPNSTITNRYMKGLIMPPEAERSTPENDANLKDLYDELDRATVPDTYDSTAMGLVTEPKNQMSCGSCAAFAATGLHETCMLKAGAKKAGLDLSEQYLVDCGYNGRSMAACEGAYPSAYPNWFAKNGGGSSPHEADMPYLDRNPKKTCPAGANKWQSGAKVKTAVFDYSCNADKLKMLVATKGAVLVGVHASDRAFGNYASGVFQGCSSKQADHAVLVVGYGVENGVDYWLVKNSWGPKWGNKGFIKIRRGTNECAIESVCVVATCESSGTAQPPPPTPAPKPVPAELSCDISELYYPGITGNYNLRFYQDDNSVLSSKVKCVNSICQPRIAGPSNGCMYICGKVKCTW